MALAASDTTRLGIKESYCLGMASVLISLDWNSSQTVTVLADSQSRCSSKPRISYCLSYSPLPSRLKTLNPACFASETESALGELNVDQILRTGFLHAGQFVSGLAESGRCNVNLPPHTGQPPSQSSYSYNGITKNSKFEIRNSKQFRNYFLSTKPFKNGVNKSIGTGKNVVVLCSLEISRIVCRKRNCSAIGSLLIIAAACTIFSAAWNSPSALTILARRSRSASACLAIARFMLSGKDTSLTSTAVTLTPHGSVCRSMISCNFRLIDSRCESRSSKGAWPSTLRSVVCDISEVALRKFSTFTTAACGSTTRK